MADWRFRAKVVGIFEIIFTIIGLIWVVLFTVGIFLLHDEVNKGAEANFEKEMGMEGAMKLGMAFLLVVVVVGVLCGFLQFYAALKLLSATEIGKDPNEAWKKAHTYKTCSWIFLILGVLSQTINGQILGLVFVILIRGGFIYIVTKFMKVLEEAKLHHPIANLDVCQGNLEEPK